MSLAVPMLETPWSEALRIVGEPWPKERACLPSFAYYNDFCLVADREGRWHCIGIVKQNGRDGDLFHAVADALAGPYRLVERIEAGVAVSGGELSMWAPFVFWRGERALLLYGHMIRNASGDYVETTMRILAGEGDLMHWTPANEGPAGDNVLFSEPHGRDAQLFRDPASGQYLLYYVVGDGWKNPEEANVVRVRTSTDLRDWSEPRTVIAPPPGFRAAESIFVLERDGLYYMWLCGFDYGRMALYISDDPFNFGDPVDNCVGEMSGHAPEIVRCQDADWIACVAIASEPGFPPGAHDLPGVFLQRLAWRDATPSEAARVHRTRPRAGI